MTTNINEAIERFYILKKKYEENKNNIIENIQSLKQSRKEKKLNYIKQINNIKCVNCGRNVGTFFSIKNDFDKLHKKYIVRCGDINTPCPLNIDFELGYCTQYDNFLNETKISIDELKMKIIKNKNNVIFDLQNKTELIAQFNLLNEELKDLTNDYGFFTEAYILVNDNPENKTILTELLITLNNKIKIINEYYKNYVENKDIQFLKSLINLYVTELIPLLKKLRNLKYQENHVELNNNLEYILTQNVYSLEKNEIINDKDHKINSFKEGVKVIKKITKKKTIKMSDEKKKTKKKLQIMD